MVVLGRSSLTQDEVRMPDVTDWDSEIRKVSRKAAANWPVVEEDDLVQEVYLHILESPKTYRDLKAMPRDNRYQTLHKIAQRLASKERDDYARFSGDFQYSVDEVRSMLESLGDGSQASKIRSSWSTGDYTMSGGGPSDPTADAAIGNARVSEAQKQLSAALKSLKVSNKRQYDAVISRFVFGEVPDRKNTALFELISRGVMSLTDKMNHSHKREFTGDKFITVKTRSGKTVRYLDSPEPGKSLGDGPGSRRAVSNSTARYLSKEGWDADYMPAPSHLRDNHIEPEVWE